MNIFDCPLVSLPKAEVVVGVAVVKDHRLKGDGLSLNVKRGTFWDRLKRVRVWW